MGETTQHLSGQWFSDLIPKEQTMKAKLKSNKSKINMSNYRILHSKGCNSVCKENLQIGWKYSQALNLKRYWYPKYIKNSRERKQKQFKNNQGAWMDISEDMTHKWSRDMWKKKFSTAHNSRN